MYYLDDGILLIGFTVGFFIHPSLQNFHLVLRAASTISRLSYVL